MSAQFGRSNFGGEPVDQTYLQRVKSVISSYGPDDCSSYATDNTSILYCAFHTTKESRREQQPHTLGTGALITWDGRLDNRVELAADLECSQVDAADVEIVATAFERWGTGCFGKLLGDWALTIYDPRTRSVVLAKDFLGTRQLYYFVESGRVTWSTVLDPLVLFADRSLKICEQYLAGWFAFYPAPDLTPYIGIRSVPPASFVQIESGKHTLTRYWDFDSRRTITYASDGDYEEHFRNVFKEAVRRRLQSDRAICAELSGGMDSSSIVCMAHSIVAAASSTTPSFHTVSYYNDSEPHWNERPYFTKVEEKLGRTGSHIDIGSDESFGFGPNDESLCVTPASVVGSQRASNNQFERTMRSQGSRVLLSGIGGDEVMGGIPTPVPELQDLIMNCQFGQLAHQLKTWALDKRVPWFHLLLEAVQGFLPFSELRVPKYKRPAPWLDLGFIKRNKRALLGYEKRLRPLGGCPSLQANVIAFEQLRRQVSCKASVARPCWETRYPYLDRELLEFVFYVPRDQLVRPGQRRSLMRRALRSLVPVEVLDRRRKAYVARAPRTAIVAEWSKLEGLTRHTQLGSRKIFDQQRFSQFLWKAKAGEEFPLISLMRSIHAEFWLRNILQHGIALDDVDPTPTDEGSWTRSFFARA